ncbi:MAG TPA: flagellin [Acidimicrobiia bacterium]|nr:flagellin [Acidimicrobiia bacterium]
MGLRINQNIAAMNAYRNLSVTDGQMAKSLEKLSSGFRINRAADDAAGLSISEGLRAQVGGLKVAVRNAQDGISVVQTAEGAMNEVHSILGRMRDLAVQASSSGSQDTNARTAAQTELTQLNAELDRIGSTTKFGSVNLLNGSAAKTTGAVTGGTTGALNAASFDLSGTFGGVAVSETVTVANGTYASAGSYQTALQTAIDNALTTDSAAAGSLKATVSDVGGGVWKVELSSAAVGNAGTFTIANSDAVGVGNGASSAQANSLSQTFQIGANNGETLAVSFSGISSSILGTSSLDLVNSASSAITALDSAIGTVSTNRANLGAVQNRLEHTISNLSVAAENLSASESRIRDTDMAQEMVSFTRSQILTQAGTAMLAQANQAPQQVLQLLRG